MSLTRHKVTCFITRQRRQGQELLLINHPNAGVQIPAGTVEPGEDLETAAIREAVEESGLRASLRYAMQRTTAIPTLNTSPTKSLGGCLMKP
jgi:8-oxo-dGTP pyrophosphatase MutT (NUDIX family)